MNEFRVPVIVGHPFRAHYRGLILGSLLHAAEAQSEVYREQGRRLQAWRAERLAQRVRRLADELQPGRDGPAPWLGPWLRTATRVAWVATLALMLADFAVFGIHSWVTGGADLALIALTVVLLVVEDQAERSENRPRQLSLFE